MPTRAIDCIIVGAGAAGLATAIFARRFSPARRVKVLEGARKPGAKLLISGSSRCNVTNAAVTEADFNGGSPAAIRRIVEFTYDYYVGHEYFVRLVVAENQAKGRHMKRSSSLRRVNGPILDMLGGVIARGQQEGVFRRDADPIEVHKAIAALGMFNVTNQYTFGTLFGQPMGGKGDVGRRRAIVADIIVCWLAPKARPAGHVGQ